MERFDLLILILGENSSLLDSEGSEYYRLIEEYALPNATLVLIFLGEKANRVIAGQQISEIEKLPPFDDYDGNDNAAIDIRGWIYEAQKNMFSGPGTAYIIRTAIFLDVSDEVASSHGIDPLKLLGRAKDTEFFTICERDGKTFFEHRETPIVERLEALIHEGDEEAQYELGLAYTSGDGVERNQIKAKFHLMKAHFRGNTKALYAAVELVDEPEPFMLEEAAKRGHFKGLQLTGKRYYDLCKNGNGNEDDLEKAEQYLGEAAKQGCLESAALLKSMD